MPAPTSASRTTIADDEMHAAPSSAGATGFTRRPATVLGTFGVVASGAILSGRMSRRYGTLAPPLTIGAARADRPVALGSVPEHRSRRISYWADARSRPSTIES